MWLYIAWYFLHMFGGVGDGPWILVGYARDVSEMYRGVSVVCRTFFEGICRKFVPGRVFVGDVSEKFVLRYCGADA